MNEAAEHATRAIEEMLHGEERPILRRPLLAVRPPAPEPQKEPEPVAQQEPIPSAKIDHTMLPIDALEEVSKALMSGRTRFGAWNWAINPLTQTEYLAKVHRHVLAHQKGEDIDPITGCTHIACAIADLMFLQSNILNGRTKDDRFKG